jgi:hypothetical protein
MPVVAGMPHAHSIWYQPDARAICMNCAVDRLRVPKQCTYEVRMVQNDIRYGGPVYHVIVGWTDGKIRFGRCTSQQLHNTEQYLEDVYRFVTCLLVSGLCSTCYTRISCSSTCRGPREFVLAEPHVYKPVIGDRNHHAAQAHTRSTLTTTVCLHSRHNRYNRF